MASEFSIHNTRTLRPDGYICVPWQNATISLSHHNIAVFREPHRLLFLFIHFRIGSSHFTASPHLWNNWPSAITHERFLSKLSICQTIKAMCKNTVQNRPKNNNNNQIYTEMKGNNNAKWTQRQPVNIYMRRYNLLFGWWSAMDFHMQMNEEFFSFFSFFFVGLNKIKSLNLKWINIQIECKVA